MANPNGPFANTDRELWRGRPGDYYGDSLFVTEGGGIGMNVGGLVVVMPLREWHKLAASPVERAPEPSERAKMAAFEAFCDVLDARMVRAEGFGVQDFGPALAAAYAAQFGVSPGSEA